MSLPPRVRAEVRRILDAEARRILEEMNADTGSTTSGMDNGPVNRGDDQGTTGLEAERIPVGTGHSDSKGMAA